jgi:hypothetical protein
MMFGFAVLIAGAIVLGYALGQKKPVIFASHGDAPTILMDDEKPEVNIDEVDGYDPSWIDDQIFDPYEKNNERLPTAG